MDQDGTKLKELKQELASLGPKSVPTTPPAQPEGAQPQAEVQPQAGTQPQTPPQAQPELSKKPSAPGILPPTPTAPAPTQPPKKGGSKMVLGLGLALLVLALVVAGVYFLTTQMGGGQEATPTPTTNVPLSTPFTISTPEPLVTPTASPSGTATPSGSPTASPTTSPAATGL